MASGLGEGLKFEVLCLSLVISAGYIWRFGVCGLFRARYSGTQLVARPSLYIYIRLFCRQHMCFAVYLATFGLQERPDKICCHLLGS